MSFLEDKVPIYWKVSVPSASRSPLNGLVLVPVICRSWYAHSRKLSAAAGGSKPCPLRCPRLRHPLPVPVSPLSRLPLYLPCHHTCFFFNLLISLSSFIKRRKYPSPSDLTRGCSHSQMSSRILIVVANVHWIFTLHPTVNSKSLMWIFLQQTLPEL